MLLDPPPGNATVDAAITRAVEAQAVPSHRSVEGIVDDAKFSVLQTYAIGWVKEATPIREAELVWILVVKQREEESESELGDESHGDSVALPECPVSSEQARSLDVVVRCVGASVALDCIGAGRGDVCSADDAGVTSAGDRFRVVVEAVQTSDFVDDRESLTGLLECGATTLNTADLLTTDACALSSPPVVLGDAGAALAPVMGSFRVGFVKSNQLIFWWRLLLHRSKDGLLLPRVVVGGVGDQRKLVS
ncbi:hypothetical protein V6N12_046428 [Hibiscus sabdariffa]|uniref:Uncharacterized protein n=1 Tax=Hibiscus sabdariffa TaxID=183260 RepID=A0ABR2DIM9_9ROSI